MKMKTSFSLNLSIYLSVCERDRQTDKQIGDVCMGAAMSEVIGQLSESHFFPSHHEF